MAAIDTIGRRATTIRTKKERTIVRYHWTDVVSFSDKTVRLDSNGWQTPTTKNRMNQASNQFGLGFRVWQKDFVWYVDTPSGLILEFADGMLFNR